MRTTIILKDDVLERAIEVTEITEKTALIHLGLEALIEKKSRERLIALGGSQKTAKSPRRRRK